MGGVEYRYRYGRSWGTIYCVRVVVVVEKDVIQMKTVVAAAGGGRNRYRGSLWVVASPFEFVRY